MSYKAIIEADNPDLYDLFVNEKLTGPRTRLKLKKGSNKISFIIDADDPVALRATLNAITKLLTIYEKSKGI